MCGFRVATYVRRGLRAIFTLCCNTRAQAFVYDGGPRVVTACLARALPYSFNTQARTMVVDSMSRLHRLMMTLVRRTPSRTSRTARQASVTRVVAVGLPWCTCYRSCRCAGKPHLTLDAGGRHMQYAGASG